MSRAESGWLRSAHVRLRDAGLAAARVYLAGNQVIVPYPDLSLRQLAFLLGYSDQGQLSLDVFREGRLFPQNVDVHEDDSTPAIDQWSRAAGLNAASWFLKNATTDDDAQPPRNPADVRTGLWNDKIPIVRFTKSLALSGGAGLFPLYAGTCTDIMRSELGLPLKALSPFPLPGRLTRGERAGA